MPIALSICQSTGGTAKLPGPGVNRHALPCIPHSSRPVGSPQQSAQACTRAANGPCGRIADEARLEPRKCVTARGGAAGGPSITADYQPGDVLGAKYTVRDVLGRGATGVTYRADAPDGRAVAVKALSLRGLADWKQLQLFEREAATLRGLSHPCIPAYLDYFEDDTERDRGFFLVQELAEGRTLADLVASGWRADEGEAKRIAKELLGVLDYLGSRRPAVTHRDVKPENIVLEDSRPGGRVYLVDFGGVQAAAAAGTSLGTTIIGTYGYMAPEQFRGAAQPASDLYALGGTLLFLLSGKPPGAFPQDGLRLDYGRELVSDPALDAVVAGLLEPMVDDRMRAREALGVLDGKLAAGRKDDAAVQRSGRQPAGGRAVVQRRDMVLDIDIPPGPLTGETVYSATFAVAWNAFVLFWTLSAASLMLSLFSLPFWAAGFMMGKQTVSKLLMRERLTLGGTKWGLVRQLAFVSQGSPTWDDDAKKTLSGDTRDLSGARVITTGYVNEAPQTCVELLEGARRHCLGEALSTEEQHWLAARINEHLQEVQGRMGDVRKFLADQQLAADRGQPGAGAQRSSFRRSRSDRSGGESPNNLGVHFDSSDNGLPLFDEASSSSDGPVFIEDWTKWADAEQQYVPAGRDARGPDAGHGERLRDDGEAESGEEKGRMPQQPNTLIEDMTTSAAEHGGDADARSPPSPSLQEAYGHSGADGWADSGIRGDPQGEALQQLSRGSHSADGHGGDVFDEQSATGDGSGHDHGRTADTDAGTGVNNSEHSDHSTTSSSSLHTDYGSSSTSHDSWSSSVHGSSHADGA